VGFVMCGFCIVWALFSLYCVFVLFEDGTDR
jgi:hypothetical protein